MSEAIRDNGKRFHGFTDSECEEHRTVGEHRAWCHTCTTWCYPGDPCPGCARPALEARVRELEQALADLKARNAELEQAIRDHRGAMWASDCITDTAIHGRLWAVLGEETQ